MSKGEYFYIPECVATSPANGEAICERWWSVHPEKGVVFWFIPNGYFASEEPSPQCNPDETTARDLTDKLVANGETHECWCGDRDTITVTEEYHPEGYPKP